MALSSQRSNDIRPPYRVAIRHNQTKSRRLRTSTNRYTSLKRSRFINRNRSDANNKPNRLTYPLLNLSINQHFRHPIRSLNLNATTFLNLNVNTLMSLLRSTKRPNRSHQLSKQRILSSFQRSTIRMNSRPSLMTNKRRCLTRQIQRKRP